MAEKTRYYVIQGGHPLEGTVTVSGAKNAITKQFAKLFDMEGCELEIREDALRAVARKAMERKTGARGLRSILEQVLLDTMYELPSMEKVAKVVVDEGAITGDSEPLLIYDGVDQQYKASKD